MALSIHPENSGNQHEELKPNAALRLAWIWYITLLFVPFLMLLAMIVRLSYWIASPVYAAVRNGWFIGSIGFLLVAAPISFVIRSRMFRSYWRGEGVSPRSYLLGMLTVWMTVEAGGIISLAGCFACRSITPCILPALAAFMFFIPLWPNGGAMGRPTGNTDDPEIYHEPR